MVLYPLWSILNHTFPVEPVKEPQSSLVQRAIHVITGPECGQPGHQNCTFEPAVTGPVRETPLSWWVVVVSQARRLLVLKTRVPHIDGDGADVAGDVAGKDIQHGPITTDLAHDARCVGGEVGRCDGEVGRVGLRVHDYGSDVSAHTCLVRLSELVGSMDSVALPMA